MCTAVAVLLKLLSLCDDASNRSSSSATHMTGGGSRSGSGSSGVTQVQQMQTGIGSNTYHSHSAAGAMVTCYNMVLHHERKLVFWWRLA